MADLPENQSYDALIPKPTTLKEILHLERIENWIFRGVSPANPRWGRVYGGQLVAQAIAACVNTLDPTKHSIHSLHSYFIRPGDDDVPIVFKVKPLKDTKAYVTRHVDAIQYGNVIFSALIQFAAPDLNVHSHTQVYDMSTVPHYDTLPSLSQDMFELSTNENLPLRNRQLLYYSAKREIPFDIKWVTREDVEWVNWSDTPTKRPARRLMWVKIKGKITTDEDMVQPMPEPKKITKPAATTTTKPAIVDNVTNDNKTTTATTSSPPPSTTTTTQTVKKFYPNPESTGALLGTNSIKVTEELHKAQKPTLMSLLQQIALAYLSDWGIIAAATKPHQMESLSPHLQLASLDHTIHFFTTNVKADDWLLYDVHSPHFANSKALLCGDLYNQNGELVARVQQEALIRVKDVNALTRHPSFFHTPAQDQKMIKVDESVYGINSNNAVISRTTAQKSKENAPSNLFVNTAPTKAVVKDQIPEPVVTVQKFEGNTTTTTTTSSTDKNDNTNKPIATKSASKQTPAPPKGPIAETTKREAQSGLFSTARL